MTSVRERIEPGVAIRRMGLADLGFVVSQHLEHFPDNVFGQLGRRFLVEYYRTFLDGPHAHAVVVVRDGALIGFLVGILDVSEHRRLVRRYHARRLAWYAAAAFCRRPRLATALLRRRLSVYLDRLRHSRRHAMPATRGIAVLSHVAVAQDYRGTGAGTGLILQFVDQAHIAGARIVSLATQSGAAGAGRLYESLGWRLAKERETFDGRRIALYDLDLRETR